MDIRVEAGTPSSVSGPAALVFAFQDADPTPVVRQVGKEFAGAFAALRRREAFTGAAGQVLVLHGRPRAKVETLVLAGLGDRRKAEPDALRAASGDGARAARDAGADRLAVVLPKGQGPLGRADVAAGAVVEGVRLGLYVFDAYKSEKSKKALKAATVVVPRAALAAARRAAKRAGVLADSVLLVRDLGNEPGNTATPTYLAEKAKAIAAAEGLKVNVLEEADMKALGMGALLGVAKGSEEPAKLIVLTYDPPRGRRVDTVAVVGKGLTFDSGGISIKPADKMEDMKFDMCGGAAVLGVLQAVARLKPAVRVVGLVPTSENMPDGAAYKPGDILKALNGTTIEINNTDAEGRLILADALAYASTRLKPRPDAIVDMATLTGAIVVALGAEFAGLVSNDDALASRVLEAAKASGDPVWRMPLVEGYRQKMKSVYADLKNSGGREGGSLTAAAFLERFVDGVPWAHVDVAGVAWTEKSGGTLSKGATGFGVRLVVRLLEAWGRG
jgi:leucyl aminopeptidase